MDQPKAAPKEETARKLKEKKDPKQKSNQQPKPRAKPDAENQTGPDKAKQKKKTKQKKKAKPKHTGAADSPKQHTNFKQKAVRSWSMRPSLHHDVALAIQGDGLFFAFHEADDADGCIQAYDTNIMGRFICRNDHCKITGWSSRVIPITIRLYPRNKYNARVYHQRCQGCEQLSRPLLDESYTERVAYRLKKWSGINVEVPPYFRIDGGPHRGSLCEGCKNGHCLKSNGLL